jgi:NADH-quinone oxidoreductase subunit M
MNFINSNLLSLITFLPLLGMILVLVTPSGRTKLIQWGSVAFSLIPFALGLVLWASFDQTSSNFQFVEQANWFPQINASYKVGVDGISLPLVVLNAFLTPLVMLISMRIEKAIKPFYALLFLFASATSGVFISLDLVLFFVFYELTLVPMYFLINQWGGANRRYASLKFFLYTLFAGLAMLLATQVIGLASGTFDIERLISEAGRPFTGSNTVNALWGNMNTWKTVAFFSFFIAFALKIPVWPLHTWLPDAHTEAPTGGSMLLAGIMLKLGGYGFLRIVLPIFPDASAKYAWVLAALAMLSIVVGAFAAWGQNDFKKLVAYSSVNHMGFTALGIAVLAKLMGSHVETEMGATVLQSAAIASNGAVLQMVTHGLSSAAMFALVGVVYDRAHTRDLTKFGGLWNIMPKYGAILIFCAMGSLGLPGLAGFVSEFLVTRAGWSGFTFYTALSMVGLLVTGIYILKALQKVLHGPLGHEWEHHPLTDIGRTEILGIAPLMIAMLILGLYPTGLLNLINTGSLKLIDLASKAVEAVVR